MATKLKSNIVDMPEDSDMIAEAMKEVPIPRPRPSGRSTTSRSSTKCPTTSRTSSTRSMGPTGTASLAKISHPTSATSQKTTFSSMKGHSRCCSTKLADLYALILPLLKKYGILGSLCFLLAALSRVRFKCNGSIWQYHIIGEQNQCESLGTSKSSVCRL